VSVAPELEAPRPAEGEGFADAVTFSFGDARAGVFGLARSGIADGTASGLALLFAGQETAAARAEGGVAVGQGQGWDAIDAGGVRSTVVEPLRRWTIRFDGGDEGGFELDYEALGAPAEVDGGGMTGYEQLCRVRGRARIGSREVAIDCLGQRGHSWGAPDWGRITLARTLGAWLDPDLGVVMSAFRPAGADDHEQEALTAVVLEGEPVAPLTIADPRLSTTYDEEDRQRRAGWELWPDDEAGYARRGAGEVLCGTSLDLGRLRLDCAFFRFRMEGREGVGRYDVLRRVEA
jgi:hypothetical protein